MSKSNFDENSKQVLDNSKKAKENWKLLYTNVQKHQRKLKEQALGNMQTIGGQVIQEESESDNEESDVSPLNLIGAPAMIVQDKNSSKKGGNSILKHLASAMQIKYKDIFD